MAFRVVYDGMFSTIVRTNDVCDELIIFATLPRAKRCLSHHLQDRISELTARKRAIHTWKDAQIEDDYTDNK